MNIQEVIEKLNKSSKKGEFQKVEISSSGINYDCNDCNDCNDCDDCDGCNYCDDCDDCDDCNYCNDCNDCNDCYDCNDQKGKQYMIFNIEVGKEFYELAMKGREG